MKENKISLITFFLALSVLVPASLMAQNEENDKDKDKIEKKFENQIIITRKNDKPEKVVIEINGDKVTINGKPIDEYNDKNSDYTVRLRKNREYDAFTRIPGSGYNWNFDDNENNLRYFNKDANHAMLGVITEKADQGVKVQSVTKESAAAKAGLKEGDIITKINDAKIQDPDDLSAIIKKHKPGEKVSVSYLRNNKEEKVTAELTKWRGMNMFSTTPGFKMDMEDFNLGEIMPKIQPMPRVAPFGQNWSWSGGSPKLGLSVQDTEDSKGVKVIEVDDESNAAKAGIIEEDIVTEVDGKNINSTDEMVKVIKESKEKSSVMIKLQRAGKTQNIEVKMPRKMKTADL
jgi:serine protease Do